VAAWLERKRDLKPGLIAGIARQTGVKLK